MTLANIVAFCRSIVREKYPNAVCRKCPLTGAFRVHSSRDGFPITTETFSTKDEAWIAAAAHVRAERLRA